MNGGVLLAIVNASQFTSYEHTQVSDLLIVLALVSIMMWAVVLVGVIIRQTTILIVRLLSHRLTASYEREQGSQGRE